MSSRAGLTISSTSRIWHRQIRLSMQTFAIPSPSISISTPTTILSDMWILMDTTPENPILIPTHNSESTVGRESVHHHHRLPSQLIRRKL
jgi:hypothetical protein